MFSDKVQSVKFKGKTGGGTKAEEHCKQGHLSLHFTQMKDTNM